MSGEVARQLVAYIIEGKRVLGVVPTAGKVVAERFFDESGGMQLVIHAPFGASINRAWGMALRKRICRTFDFELQATATDDGLNFSLGPSMGFPVGDVFNYLSPNTVEEVLTQAVFQAPLFGTRWRWNATRFLAMLRHNGEERRCRPHYRGCAPRTCWRRSFRRRCSARTTPCQGDIEPPDHPLVFETTRDCLTEAMSLEGLKEVLRAIRSGEIEVFAKDTVQPSVFAHQILNAMPYAFLDDAPLEERRARAVSLRRALPEDAQGPIRPGPRGDPGGVGLYAWPAIRDADELHDALLTLGVAPEGELVSRTQSCSKGGPPFAAAQGNMSKAAGGSSRDMLASWLEELARSGRALFLALPEGAPLWLAAEYAGLVAAAYPDAVLEGRVGLLSPLNGNGGGANRAGGGGVVPGPGVGRVVGPVHRRRDGRPVGAVPD